MLKCCEHKQYKSCNAQFAKLLQNEISTCLCKKKARSPKQAWLWNCAKMENAPHIVATYNLHLHSLISFEIACSFYALIQILIHNNILKHIPTCAKFNLANKNKYGQQNKGAGLIEYWRHSANIYSRYKWVLFYESRLFLEDFSFFNSFFQSHFHLSSFQLFLKSVFQFV